MFFVFAAIEIVGFPRRRYDKLHVVAGTIIVLIAGFKYETGVDWLAYQAIFENTSSLSDAFIMNDYSQVFLSMDFGYCLLNSTIKMFGGSIQTVFFLVSLSSTILLIKNLRYYTDYVLTGVLIYYAFFFFIFDMSGIRQGLAIQLFLYSVRYISQNKFKKFFLWLFLAVSIHWSAILLIVIYFFANKKVSSKSGNVFFIISLLLFTLQIKLLTPFFEWLIPSLGGYVMLLSKVDAYTTNEVFALSRTWDLYSIYTFIRISLLLFICTKYRDELESKSEYFNLFYNLLLLQIFVFFVLFEFVEISERTRFYFLISEVIICSVFISISRMSIKLPILIACSFIVFLNSYPFMLSFPSAVAYNPYQNYIVHIVFDTESDGESRLLKHKEIHLD